MLKNLKKYNVNVMNEDLGKRTKDLVVAPKIFSVSLFELLMNLGNSLKKLYMNQIWWQY